MQFDHSHHPDLASALALQWLETDGRGGYRYILHVNPEDYDRAQEVLDVDQDRRPMADYHLNLHRRFEAKS